MTKKLFSNDLSFLLAGATGGDPLDADANIQEVFTYDELSRWISAIEATYFCQDGKRTESGLKNLHGTDIAHFWCIRAAADYLWPLLPPQAKARKK